MLSSLQTRTSNHIFSKGCGLPSPLYLQPLRHVVFTMGKEGRALGPTCTPMEQVKIQPNQCHFYCWQQHSTDERSPAPEFVNILRSPGIDSQPGGTIPWNRFLGSLTFKNSCSNQRNAKLLSSFSLSVYLSSSNTNLSFQLLNAEIGQTLGIKVVV